MSIYKKFLFVFAGINLLISFIYFNQFEVRAAFDIETGASTFISQGSSKAGDLTNITSTVTKEFEGVGQFLTMIGAGVMVAVVSYMGIKYLVSPPDKQAALKQQLIGVVVAGIVIFGAYGIWKAILDVVSNF